MLPGCFALRTVSPPEVSHLGPLPAPALAHTSPSASVPALPRFAPAVTPAKPSWENARDHVLSVAADFPFMSLNPILSAAGENKSVAGGAFIGLSHAPSQSDSQRNSKSVSLAPHESTTSFSSSARESAVVAYKTALISSLGENSARQVSDLRGGIASLVVGKRKTPEPPKQILYGDRAPPHSRPGGRPAVTEGSSHIYPYITRRKKSQAAHVLLVDSAPALTSRSSSSR